MRPRIGMKRYAAALLAGVLLFVTSVQASAQEVSPDAIKAEEIFEDAEIQEAAEEESLETEGVDAESDTECVPESGVESDPEYAEDIDEINDTEVSADAVCEFEEIVSTVSDDAIPDIETNEDGDTTKVTATFLFDEKAFSGKFSDGSPYIYCYTKNGTKIESYATSIKGGKAVVHMEPGGELFISRITMAAGYVPVIKNSKGNAIRMTTEQIYTETPVWKIGRITQNTVLKVSPAVCYLNGSKGVIGYKLSGYTAMPIKGLSFEQSVREVSGRPALVLDSKVDSKPYGFVEVLFGVNVDDPVNYYEIETDGSYRDWTGAKRALFFQYDGSTEDINENRNPKKLATHFVTSIPVSHVYNAFVSGRKLTLEALQTRGSKTWDVYVKIDSGIKIVDTYYGNRFIGSSGPNSGYYPLFTGFMLKGKSPAHFLATPKVGYRIVSAQMASLTGKNPKTYTGKAASDITYNSTDGVIAEYKTEPAYYADIGYLESVGPGGKKVPYSEKTGKYEVCYNRRVYMSLEYGEEDVAPEIKARIGKQDVTAKLREAKVLEVFPDIPKRPKNTFFRFTGDNDLVRGKTVDFTIYEFGTDEKDKSAVTFSFKVDDNDKSIDYPEDSYTIPVGATGRNISAKGKGLFETALSVNGVELTSREYTDTENGVAIILSDDGRTITASSAASLVPSEETEYTVDIIDKVTGEKCDTLRVDFGYGEVENAPAPTVRAAEITNNSIDISIGNRKYPGAVEGLYYLVSAKRTDDKSEDKGLLKDEVRQFVSSTDSSCTVNLLKDGATETEAYDGDPSAKYTVSVDLVQVCGSTPSESDIVARSKNSASTSVTMKEGGIFAKKLTLKKPGKTRLYSNQCRENCGKYGGDYRVTTGYDVSASVRRLERAELIDGRGRVIDAAASGGKGRYLDVLDKEIRIYPGGDDNTDKLAPGKYTLTAYALEHTGEDVVAKQTVTVVKGIENLAIDGLPERIYVTPKRDTTLKLKAYDADTGRKTTAVKWELVCAKWGNYADGWEIIDKPLDHKGISISRTGVLKISKNTKIPVDFGIFVRVRAADHPANHDVISYSGEGKWASSFRTENNIFLLANNTGNYDIRTGSYTVTDGFRNTRFDDEAARGGCNYQARIAMVDHSRDSESLVEAAFSVTGSAASLVEYKDGRAFIGFKKPGKVKISTKALDGRGKISRSFSLTGSDKSYRMGFGLWDSVEKAKAGEAPVSGNLTGYDPSSDPDYRRSPVAGGLLPGTSFTYDNYKPLGEKIPLEVVGFKSSDSNLGYITAGVGVKGGRLAKATKYNVSCYYIIPTAATTKVTLTDRRYKKNNKITITINNKLIGGSAFPATNAVASKGSIYSFIDYTGAGNYNASPVNMITYSLSAKKNKSLTADYAVVNLAKSDAAGGLQKALSENCTGRMNGGNAFDLGEGMYAFPLSEGKFTVDWSKNGSLDVASGLYRINVTPANRISVGGTDRYVAAGRPASLKLKAVIAPKAEVNYPKNLDTLGTGNVVIEQISVKNIVPGSAGIGMVAAGKPVLKDVNTAGRLNNFTGSFTFHKPTATLTYTGGDIGAADKKDLTGYVAYGYQSLDGIRHYSYHRITIK